MQKFSIIVIFNLSSSISAFVKISPNVSEHQLLSKEYVEKI